MLTRPGSSVSLRCAVSGCERTQVVPSHHLENVLAAGPWRCYQHRHNTTPVRIKAANSKDILAFATTSDGDEVRVRWTRRLAGTLHGWRCDACPDADNCTHIDAVRHALHNQETP